MEEETVRLINIAMIGMAWCSRLLLLPPMPTSSALKSLTRTISVSASKFGGADYSHHSPDYYAVLGVSKE